MARPNSNNDRLSEIMKTSRLEMPFGDFEETVMRRLHKETLSKEILSRDRKLSFIFFLLATGLWLIINSHLQRSPYNFLDIPPGTMRLLFQAIFVLIFLVQLEKNLHLLKRWKKQKLEG